MLFINLPFSSQVRLETHNTNKCEQIEIAKLVAIFIEFSEVNDFESTEYAFYKSHFFIDEFYTTHNSSEKIIGLLGVSRFLFKIISFISFRIGYIDSERELARLLS